MSDQTGSSHAEKARLVELAVFDVDGVLTDGRLYFSEQGHETKAFHTRDGLGIKALMSHGIKVAIITARQSQLVARRMAELGIEHLMQGREDKSAALGELIARLGFTPDQVAYTGDDLVDWPAMRLAGFKCAPADACAWIRQRADFVTASPGGHGAAREVCERILEARGLLSAWQDSFQ
jgi:3-deoxy-D-manno-octulosonate 8-phosphate phosphatase (KDO 8-P phosphatase)